MKRTLSFWLGLAAAAGLLALVVTPVMAQTAPTTGKIHGKVINPTGQPQGGGTVGLSTDGGNTNKYTFQVTPTGEFSGEAAPGTYTLVYRDPNTPAGKQVDSIRAVKIIAGQDLEQNDDMSRAEYIDKMTPEEKKQLEQLRQQNAAAMKANEVINKLNADLKIVSQDRKDIDGAGPAALQALGGKATKSDLDAKILEIKTAKYTDIESLMTADTTIKPEEALLWTNLAFGQAGLKKYDEAIASYKKAVDLETASKKPRPPVIAQAQAGLGEIYARTGKVADANAAFDAAAKSDPTSAALFLRNQAIIFYQESNSAAEVTAADDAIKSNPNPNDPSLAIVYYIKGQGLVANATVDPKNPSKVVLPPDCAAAYQKYLELAPTGQFAAEVTSILQTAGLKPAPKK